MLVKIDYFPQFDQRSDITTPLSSVLTLDEVSILRNGSNTIFAQYSSLSDIVAIYPNASTFSNLEQNVYVVANLFADEDLDSLTIKFSDSRATMTKTLNDDNTLTIVLTSEDELTNISVRLFKNTIVNIADPIIYSTRSITDTNKANQLSINCRIFEPIEVNVDTTTLKVGTIHLPFSYFTDSGPSGTDIPSLSFIYSADTIQYISSTVNDPDSETLDDGTASPLTLVNSATFDGDESIILDSNFVYIKLVRNSESIYYKLVKNQDYDSDLPVNVLKAELSDKYIHVFLGTYAVLAEDLTTNQVIDINTLNNLQNVLDYLKINNIRFYNILGYYDDLIDVNLTNALQSFSVQKSYNQLFNDPASFGFINSDVDNVGKTIANMMHSIISTIPDSSTLYPATLQFLACVAELNCPTNPDYYTQDTKDDISLELKTAYITESATVRFLVSNFNNRHFKWISSRLSYISNQIESGIITYLTSKEDIDNIITLFNSLTGLNNQDVTTTPAFSQTFALLFFNNLDKLKINNEVIQRISF